MAIRSGQASNGVGWSPLAYQTIESWARLTGANPTPFEVEILQRIDAKAAVLFAGQR